MLEKPKVRLYLLEKGGDQLAYTKSPDKQHRTFKRIHKFLIFRTSLKEEKRIKGWLNLQGDEKVFGNRVTNNNHFTLLCTNLRKITPLDNILSIILLLTGNGEWVEGGVYLMYKLGGVLYFVTN